VIEAGDMIIGDADGLLCVPYDEVEDLYPLARQKYEDEISTFADLSTSDQAAERAPIFADLRKAGCFIEE
jgi:regulator of RNase E activity RraA